MIKAPVNRGRWSAFLVTLAWLSIAPAWVEAQCIGDCDDDGFVTVDEIVTGVNIALGARPVADCLAMDRDSDGFVTVDELVTALTNALGGCPLTGGWDLTNPLPTINDLFAVDYIGLQEGWAVGGFGVILHTTDGGRSWENQSIAAAPDLFGVDFVDGQTGCAVGYDPETGQPTILKTVDGGDSWQLREANTLTPVVLTAVTFVDRMNGWATGELGVVLQTTDGGDHWTPSQDTDTTETLHAVAFVDNQTGWAVGDLGTIIHTTDGATWTRQTSPTNRDLFGLHFVDAQLGFAVGDDGTILRTTNGGGTWEVRSTTIGGQPVTNNFLFDVAFADAQNGWAVGDTDPVTGFATIVHTNDGGTSWRSEDSRAWNPLFTVTALLPQTARAAGSVGTLLETTDGGGTWSILNPATTNPLFATTFVSATEAYAVGAVASMARSTDAGLTWHEVRHGIDIDTGLFAITAAGPQNIWAAGDSGVVIATRNGGQSWVRQTTNTNVALFGIAFVNATQGWVVGETGTILSTTNGGDSWTPQSSGTGEGLNSLSFVDALQGWVGADNGVILHTENGGINWVPQDSGTEQPIFGISCATTEICYAVGGIPDDTTPTQLIARTEDGGENWESLEDVDDALFTVFARGSNLGWAVGDFGIILATTDRGLLWNFQNSGGFETLNSVAFADDNTGVIVGQFGLVLQTTTGGD